MQRPSLTQVATILVPIAVTIFLGNEIYQYAQTLGIWQPLALVGAILTAIGLELVGIRAGAATVALYQQRNTAGTITAAAILMLYTILIATQLDGVLRIVMFIAPATYILLGLEQGSREGRVIEQQRQKQELEHQQELELLEARLKHERLLQQAQLRHKLKQEQVQVAQQPRQAKQLSSGSSVSCPYCSRTFAGERAMAGHLAHCKEKPHT